VETREVVKELEEILNAKQHRPFHPGTEQHRTFLHRCQQKTQALADRYPFLSMEAELAYFSG
jgi:hypothetical protein